MSFLFLSLNLTFIACAKFSSSSLGPAPLLLLTQTRLVEAIPAPVNTWWSGDGSYLYRKKLKFGNTHSNLLQNYTALFSMSTLSSDGVGLANGDDVRIVHHGDDWTATELDRLGGAWNSAATTIEFRLSTAVAANQDQPDKGGYYVYFGNAAAGSPPADEADVYYFIERFTRADGGVGNGWTAWDDGNGGTATVTTNALRVAPQDNGRSAGAKKTFALGPISGNFTLTFSWNMPANTETVWAFMMGLGDSTVTQDDNRRTGVGPGIYSCEMTSLNCGTGPNAILSDSSAYREASLLGAHTFRLDVNRATHTYTYTRDGILTISNVGFVNNVDTIDQIKFAGDSVSTNGGEEHTYDDVKIVMRVDSAPSITLEQRETVD